MPAPCLVINGHDYSAYIKEIKPSLEDVDADGTGRDILTGRMYRSRIGSFNKWTISMLRLTPTLLRQLETDMSAEFFSATLLESETDSHVSRVYYRGASFNKGVQRYIRSGTREGYTVYDGVTFSLIERG